MDIPLKTIFFVFLALFLKPVLAASPVWLVESGQNHLYLAGTVHVLRNSDYPLPKAFETAYADSQVLTFETDISKSQDMNFQSKLIQAVTLPGQTTLQDVLKPQTLHELNTFLETSPIQLSHLIKFKPSMVAMTLTLVELKKLGVGDHGVDQYYFNKATQDGKTTLALETLQQQIDFLANMGKGVEDLMIKQTLEDIKTLQTQFSQMISSWRTGDLNQLEALFVEPMKQDFEPVYQQLLVNRNRAWMPQISEYLKTKKTEMVLVGSAHLLGEDGLLYLLQKQGYRVTQLD